MKGRLKISPHAHSGRLLPHHHTSYGAVFGMLLLVGLLLVGASYSALAADPPPESGYIGLNGAVPGPPPKSAAVIKKPVNGTHTSTSPVNVSGTCPDGTVVELFKNDIFAGSGQCLTGGTFSFDIDLLYGGNVLIARVYDALDQAGPDSNHVSVSYDALPPQTDPLANLGFANNQLVLVTTAVYRGVFPGQPMALPIQVLGGTPPYAINIVWGDAGNTLQTRNDNVSFTSSHTYSKPGTFPVTIQATDAQQRVAFLTIATIVNGKGDQIGRIAGAGTPPTIGQRLLIAWPLYGMLAVAIIAFFVGERREKHVLEAAGI